ncbi:cytochrome c oxidase assembly factor CtaG [Virgibacillus sp. 179-BFC.A HS]|uniref:Cytochrome c oxidase assembly factor CtaG n=1 Tax=Tigheibacillus jepli TaxID=3035914 RepID=A0ABU5CI37_9BACI|nr:cytochrome c oxidase assembly factor CtaG [Virgibacillus sp. 179-BFC.A HS]MDY0405993.1 cytochrome c oxidase assembly factor CtaG [Virgibacillus sp. 179-BFC.A HS]
MWLELQIFGFRALWSPYFLIYVIALALLYYLVTGPLRNRFGGEHAKPTGKQQTAFYVGMLLLYIVKGSPVDLLTHIMLTFHMIQMAVFYLVFPILMIIGIPEWIWKKFVYQPVVYPVVKLVTKPLISLLLFNALFSLYHLPAVFDFSKSSQVAHTTIGLVLLVAAFIMWFPIITPLKEFNRMTPLLKIFYIFGNGVLITPACVLIIFASTPLFDAYSASGAWLQSMSLCVPSNVLDGISMQISGPEMFSPMGTMEDQQLGGIIMKIMQEVTYGIILATVFFQWFTRESLKVDPLPPESQYSHSH